MGVPTGILITARKFIGENPVGIHGGTEKENNGGLLEIRSEIPTEIPGESPIGASRVVLGEILVEISSGTPRIIPVELLKEFPKDFFLKKKIWKFPAGSRHILLFFSIVKHLRNWEFKANFGGPLKNF